MSAHHCHCTDCRKMTGSGKATIVMVPTEKLKLNGELKTFTITGSDGSHVARGFCPNCGSQLISYVEEMPNIRFIKAGSLDNGEWVKINSSFWSQSAEPWSPVDPTAPHSQAIQNLNFFNRIISFESQNMTDIAVVVGVGAINGLGAAIARRFARELYRSSSWKNERKIGTSF